MLKEVDEHAMTVDGHLGDRWGARPLVRPLGAPKP
jgi:hypothetical protein